jgi:DNA-binding transcriptional LysR family regulator
VAFPFRADDTDAALAADAIVELIGIRVAMRLANSPRRQIKPLDGKSLERWKIIRVSPEEITHREGPEGLILEVKHIVHVNLLSNRLPEPDALWSTREALQFYFLLCVCNPQAKRVEETLQYCLSVRMLNSAWIDPLLLKTFVAVSETGSFAKAAIRVGRTQSAISMQMKRLEALAGPPALFTRVGRSMVLTERAEAMVRLARRVLKAHEEMLHEFNRCAEAREIRLGSPEDYVDALLPKVLHRFATLYPKVEVSVVCDTSEALHRQVAEEKVDLAVVTAGKETPISAAIRQEPLVWVASTDHRPEMEPIVPLAMFQPGCMSRALAIDACVEADIDHRVAYSPKPRWIVARRSPRACRGRVGEVFCAARHANIVL